MIILWQIFEHPGGKCAVPAKTEDEARRILARNHWNGLDPQWPHVGMMLRPRPPWAPWERLERWQEKHLA